MGEEILKVMNFSEMLFNRDERLLDYISFLQEENEDMQLEIGRLNNKLNKIKKYVNSHTRKMVAELGSDKINDKKYRDVIKISVLDKDTILKIIDEGNDDVRRTN